MTEIRPRLGNAYRLLLALLILLLPVQFSTSLGFRFAPSDVVLALVVLFAGVRMITSKDDWSTWHLLLVVVFSGSILSAAIRQGTVTQWALVNKYIGVLILLLLYLVVVQYTRSLWAIWRIVRLVLLSVVLQAAIALPLYFVGLVYEPLHVFRIQGLAGDPNAYGGLIVVGLALHWSTINTSARLVSRRLSWPVTLLLLANVLLSFSRSSWIAFVFVVCATLLLRPRAWAHVILPPVLGVIAVLLFLRSYFAEAIVPLILRPDQIGQRFAILGDAVNSFLAHPILGSGLGTYLQEHGVQVHNTLFWILAEMGLVGLAVVMGFLVLFAWRGYRAYRITRDENRGLVAGLLVAHLAMIGLSFGIEALYQRSWWVVMALLNAVWVLTVKSRASLGAAGVEAGVDVPDTRYAKRVSLVDRGLVHR